MEILIRNPKLAYKKIVDCYLLVDMKDENKVHRLNELASVIWQYCDGVNTTDTIIKMVAEEYEQEANQINDEIKSFISQLKDQRLLVESCHKKI